MRYPHIMIDLETFGTGPRAVVASIGAACFCPEAGIGPTFYRILDMDSQQRAGREFSASTVLWWLAQSEAARQALQERGETVETALCEFTDFVNDTTPGYREVCVWGNGADFDLVILGTLYDDFGVPRPWRYHKQRCFRTLRNLAPSVTKEAEAAQPRAGTYHNAADDAAWQALIAVSLLRIHGIAEHAAKD